MKSVTTAPATSFTKTPSSPVGQIAKVNYRDLSRVPSSIVDLRSPLEYERGHIPNAINIPLFDNEERHKVGLLYKQVGKLEAIQLGLEFVAQKVDVLLEQLMSLPNDEENPILLHCWRGGMRSMSVARLLATVGVSSQVLTGGYKAYRRDVLNVIDSFRSKDVLVLMGRTGVGKTELLRKSKGVPVLDFERYANHRGSVFGDLNQKESVPTQQNFENQIANHLFNCGHESFYLVEIENYFAHLNLPKTIRDKMLSSPVLILEKNMESRVRHILADYALDWRDSLADEVCERIDVGLAKHFSRDRIEDLKGMVREKKLEGVVSQLLSVRYDPLYDRKLGKSKARVISEIDVSEGYDDALSFIERYQKTLSMKR